MRGWNIVFFACVRKIRGRTHRSIILTALCLLAVPAVARPAAEVPRPITVQDLLRLQDVSRGLFSNDGQTIALETLKPYEDAERFDVISFLSAHFRAETRLWRRDPAGHFEPLAKTLKGWPVSFSPDASKLLLFRLQGQCVELWMVDLQFFEEKRLVGSAVWASDQTGPFWLDNHRILVGRLPDGQPTELLALSTDVRTKLPQLWDRQAAGRVATVAPLYSGRAGENTPDDQGGDIAVLDVESGNASSLASGEATLISRSPDGSKALALMRNGYEVPRAGQKLQPGWIKFRAVVLDLSVPSAFVVDCKGCKLMNDQPVWGAGARLVALALKSSRYEQPSPRPLIVDTQSGDASVEAAVKPDETLLLEDRPLYVSVKDNSILFKDTLGSPLKRIATSGMPKIVGATGESILYLDRGFLHAANASGDKLVSATPLGADIVRTSMSALNGHGSILLDDTHGLLWIYNAGRVSSVPLGVEPGRRILDVSEDGTSVLAKSGKLVVDVDVRTSAGISPLIHLNGDYANLQIPKSVLIKRRDGSGLADKVYLPVSYDPRKKYPAVMDVYPGMAQDLGTSFLDESPLVPVHTNYLILAAEGFVVYQPEIALSPRYRPMDNISQVIAAAADAAIDRGTREGYLDPENVAVMGQSFGGFSVGAIISHSHRFKAAIATSGFYDLRADYGMLEPRRRLWSLSALLVNGMGYSEYNQVRMGVPPWIAPERYRKNSASSDPRTISTPFMIVHGDLDVLPMSDDEIMFTSLYRLAKDAVFLRYWGEEHRLDSPANLLDFDRRRLAWLQRYLHPATPR